MRYTDLPFPAYPHLPGTTPHPERDPRGHSFGAHPSPVSPLSESTWREHVCYRYGLDLFNYRYYWEAHVEWERIWAVQPNGRNRTLLQAVIQLAAAMVKAREGNRAGAVKLMSRALEKMRPDSESARWMGLEIQPLIEEMEARIVDGQLATWLSLRLALSD